MDVGGRLTEDQPIDHPVSRTGVDVVEVLFDELVDPGQIEVTFRDRVHGCSKRRQRTHDARRVEAPVKGTTAVVKPLVSTTDAGPGTAESEGVLRKVS